MPKQLISLHNHMQTSFLDGVSAPRDWIEKAVELKMPALALTDHGNCCGILDFYQEAYREKKGKRVYPGFTPLLGQEFYIVTDLTCNDNAELSNYHLVVLAKNNIGYQNLIKLSTEGFFNYGGPKNKKKQPRIDIPTLFKYSEGLIVTTACIGSFWGQSIIKDQYKQAKQLAKIFKKQFKDDFYIEIQPLLIDKNWDKEKKDFIDIGENIQEKANRGLLRLADELDIKTIITFDAHYPNKEDKIVQDVLILNSYSGKQGWHFYTDNHYLQSNEECWSYLQKWHKYITKDQFNSMIDNTYEIRDKCKDLKLDLYNFDMPKYKYEDHRLCEDGDDAISLILKIVRDNNKISLKDTEYKARLQRELALISKYNFLDYFLILEDIIYWAKNNDIMVGPGRGCLVGDSHVLEKNGFKKLSEIKIGDSVCTHDGNYQNVTNIFEYPINEELLEIKSDYSYKTTILTKDHKIYAFKRKRIQYANDKWNHKRRIYEKNIPKPSWIKASDLEVGDLTYLPKVCNQSDDAISNLDIHYLLEQIHYKHKIIGDKIEIKLPKNNEFSIRYIHRKLGIGRGILRKIKNNHQYKCYRKSTLLAIDKLSKYLHKREKTILQWRQDSNTTTHYFPRFINIDENMAYFLGRWVGDGWKNRAGGFAAIAFHKDDQSGIDKILKFAKSLSVSHYINYSKNKKLTQIYFYGPILWTILDYLFPKYKNNARTKYLGELTKLPKYLLKYIIDGLVDSDGSVQLFKDENPKYCIDTTSKTLMLQIKEILLYLGIPSGITIREPFLMGKYLCRRSYKITFKWTNQYEKECWIPIRKITKTSKYKKVYDISVENNSSYLTSNLTVHNSVGGSLTAFALDITQVDPIKFNCPFERFMNEDRLKGNKNAIPDIDVDFSHPKKVKQYIINKFGEMNVAAISTVQRMGIKSAITDAARIILPRNDKEFEYWNVKKLTEQLDDTNAQIGDHKKFYRCLKGEHAKVHGDEAYPELNNTLVKYLQEYKDTPLDSVIEKMAGKSRQTAIHACAIVISDQPLTDKIPLMYNKPANEDKVLCTQYTMGDVEACGLVKFDILKLDTLLYFLDCIKMVKKRHNIDIVLEKLSLNDSKTLQAFSVGDTTSVFQFNTDGMQNMLRDGKVSNFSDLPAYNSLYRPGPLGKGMDKHFIKRKHGKEKIEYLHELLEPILRETFGVILYQEQVSEIVHKIGGFTRSEADVVRRMVSKSRGEELIQFEAQFLEYATKQIGLSLELASELWQQLVSFGDYGLNRAHAVEYGLIGYWCQWLKVHYPLEWWAAVLRNAKQKEIQTVYKKYSDIIRLPDINKSKDNFYINNDDEIVMPLTIVHGVGVNAVQEIVKKQPFRNFEDFYKKVHKSKVRKNVFTSLILAGAFKEDIQILIDQYFGYRKEEVPQEYKNLDRIKLSGLQEKSLPVLFSDYHEMFKDFFSDVQSIDEVLNALSGHKVVTGGKIKKTHRIINKRDEPQMFITLANDDKELTVIAFSECLYKYDDQLVEGNLVLTWGKVNEYNGSKNLILEGMEVFK